MDSTIRPPNVTTRPSMVDPGDEPAVPSTSSESTADAGSEHEAAISELLQRLSDADPADAVEVAVALAERLGARLDEEAL